MLAKDHKSERNIISLLELLLAFDKFHGLPFTSINNKEQILAFLNHRYSQKDREWVQREHDIEGRWVTSWNCYLGLLRTFFSVNSSLCLLLQYFIIKQVRSSVRTDRLQGILRVRILYFISLTSLCIMAAKGL